MKKIGDFKKLRSLLEDTEEFIKIFKQFLPSPKIQYNLNEIAELYSESTEEIIKKIEVNDKLTFAGGIFKITYTSSKEFKVSMDGYFQDSAKKWVKKETNNLLPTSNLTESALKELQDAKEVSYEISNSAE
ncbi:MULTISPECIES: hypothetical protein [Bacillus]|uniref:hypothetical protein n=1 Tax=Bacillus TaxID=1386 RepID=UPI0002B8D3C4|nr:MULTISPECIES: hypothetical protein [Bacillus]MBL3754744.1 hypothetical protein [Bacillus cereus]MCC2412108.1 hypothetical protein [Bacillus paranthracis]MDA2143632.1 hypothetical protein [Bacillus cereus group sp. Bc248]MDA2171568.1 hypothetical protein [Bacillus cereus group sp. Bc247]MDK7488386.1 hypothetical protein [Bacillus paranthracis]